MPPDHQHVPHLILGGSGLIAARLATRLAERGDRVVTTSRTGAGNNALRLDLAKPIEAARLPTAVDVAYPLAAITSMAACESDSAGTALINVERTVEVSQILRARGAHLVFVSTNLVHSPDRQFARADTEPAPQNVYAAQKAEVERRLLSTGSASVLRITKIAEGLQGLVTPWAEALANGKPVRPFSDLICAPIPLDYVVEAAIRLAKGRHHGIHQISADRDVDYPWIARQLAVRLDADPGLVQPVRSKDAGVRLAAAPANTTLDAAPTEALLELPAMTVEVALEPILARAIALRG